MPSGMFWHLFILHDYAFIYDSIFEDLVCLYWPNHGFDCNVSKVEVCKFSLGCITASLGLFCLLRTNFHSILIACTVTLKVLMYSVHVLCHVTKHCMVVCCGHLHCWFSGVWWLGSFTSWAFIHWCSLVVKNSMCTIESLERTDSY